MKKILLLLILITGEFTFINAQTTEVKPTGVYKDIDVTRHKKIIEILNGNDKKLKQQAVDSILKRPNYYIPPVIYALSRELFSEDKKYEASFWFYLAQLRARYDANLCMDNSAKQAVGVLNNEYGPGINQFAFKNIDSLEKIVTRVVSFVRSNQEDYDHRWINLYGMDAMIAGLDEKSEKKELSQPLDKWAEIKKKTVDDYYSDFNEYVIKPRKK